MKKLKFKRRLLRAFKQTFSIKLCYKDIFGFFSGKTLYTRMVERFPSGSHFVEVGSFQGRSTCFLAQSVKRAGKKIRIEAVDTFEGNEEHKEMLRGKELYSIFLKNMKLAGVLDVVEPRRMTSEEAAKAHEDGSLDFVYIDAAHDYDSVCRDIEAWLPKVKASCILAGDDYAKRWPEVIRAVDKKLGPENITIVPRYQWVYEKKATD